jgi:hypothetical protein
MGLLQKLITSIVPKTWAKAIEADSREWMIQCPCGEEISIWDAGGIRYKAAGEPRQLRRCAKCGQRTWHRIYRRKNLAEPQEPAGG